MTKVTYLKCNLACVRCKRLPLITVNIITAILIENCQNTVAAIQREILILDLKHRFCYSKLKTSNETYVIALSPSFLSFLCNLCAYDFLYSMHNPSDW